MRKGVCMCLVLVVLLIPVSVVADPQTAGKQVRVKMSLEVKGTYQHTGPKKMPQDANELPIKLSVDNSYSVEYVVSAETILTDPQKVNPLDPASQKEMDEYNAKVKARDDREYHSADNLRRPGMGGSGSPDGMNPGMMNMEHLQEMQEKIKACGSDQSCMQRIAMEMMAEQQASAISSGPGAQVQADIRAISEMCINEKHQPLGTKGYEKCMEAEGRKRSTVPTSSPADEPEVPELPDRYWLYRNYNTDCQFKSHAKLNESYTYGYLTDGEGGGQYRENTDVDKREGDSDPKAAQPCVSVRAVFDSKTNLYWTELPLTMVEFPVTVRHETYSKAGTYGRVEHADEINKWIDSILQGAPASGTKKGKFGFETATFTWSFVRE